VGETKLVVKVKGNEKLAEYKTEEWVFEMVVCRNCDLPMEYEGENPRGYHLFRCKACGNRVGIQEQRSDVGREKGETGS
jgi:tRNA(Ile2) C34 agmatinyltransferase TiaS